MHHQNLYSIYKKLSAISALTLGCKFHFIHTIIARPTRLIFSFTEEVLASKIGPVLQSCSGPHPDLSVSSIAKQGQQIHAQITVNGLNNLGMLETRILGVYLLCNKFFDARNLFYKLELSYASPWNWMIRGFTTMGWFDFALLFYFKMLGFGTSPDKYTFPYVIKACGGLHAVGLGRLVHGSIRDFGFEKDVFIGSALIKFYSENGCVDNARCLFDKMLDKDAVLWNVMINCYAKKGNVVDNVIELFRKMKISEIKPNSVTFASVLSVCGSERTFGLGTQVHGHVIRWGLEMDSAVSNTLVAMYAKCRSLFDAQKLFDSVAQADLVTWNAIIGGYVQNGFMYKALELFLKMLSIGVGPDSTTFASLLPIFSESEALNQIKEIHCYIFRQNVIMDVFLKNALIDMYFKCRRVDMACKVFNHSPAVDVVICTAMISGFVLNGMDANAIEMFRWVLNMKMWPNAVTLASVLPATASLAALKFGKELHGNVLKNGLERRCYVGSAITDMYAKCGRLDLACLVFSRMPERDAICWNSMITSYCQNAKPKEAIDLFRQMGMEGVKCDCVSISAALSACANLPALFHGKEIHGFMTRGSFSSDLFAESSLIDMYAKCGRLDLARSVFDNMKHKNEVSWNSIIAGYGNHGCLDDSVALFNAMIEHGFEPDHVTFLAVISACGHAGRVEEGKQYFHCMTREFKIAARMEHYACIIDLFGRAGRLDEAFQVIKTMPFTPDAGIWGTLLGACRVHGNVELAVVASGHLFHLDPQNSGYYVLLANVQADAGKWEGVHTTRKLMKERGVEKIPGYSWIEVNNTTHMFVAGDPCHPQSSQIYLILNYLLLELQTEGYVPQFYHPIPPSNFAKSLLT